MLIEKKDKDEFYKLFEHMKRLNTTLGNIPAALEGQPERIQFEINELKRAAEEELVAVNIKLRAFEAKMPNEPRGLFRKNARKRYEEVESSDIPLTEINKHV